MEVLNRDLAANTGGITEDGTDIEGIDDKQIHCFLEAGLQSGTLRTDLTEKDCIFLVNLMNQANKKAVPFEQFIDFVIPQSSKKISTRLLKKIKRKDVGFIKK